MPNSSGTKVSPLRIAAAEYIQAEIARVGVGKLDRQAIVRVFVERGAARSRMYAWFKEEVALAVTAPKREKAKAKAAAAKLEADVAQAESMVAALSAAEVVRAMPTGRGFDALKAEARAAIKAAAVPDSPHAPPDSLTVDESGTPVKAPTPPAGVATVMEKLERAMVTVDHCISYSYGPNGQIRNPRMGLAAADGLRKCLETALKLHEAVNNIQAVQEFIDEILAALREESPEFQARIIERMRGVTARWAK